MIYVHEDFVEAALQARYEAVVEIWGGAASIALWPQALELLLASGELDQTPSYYVDNYLVNRNFINREENQTDGEWEYYCENNDLIYNTEYACSKL